MRAGQTEICRYDSRDGSAVLDLPHFHPWCPEDPFLYDIEITCGADHVFSYFGMRKISFGADTQGHPRILLNNRPYFNNGLLDQGYWA